MYPAVGKATIGGVFQVHFAGLRHCVWQTVYTVLRALLSVKCHHPQAGRTQLDQHKQGAARVAAAGGSAATTTL